MRQSASSPKDVTRGTEKPLGSIAAGRREAKVQRTQLAGAEVRIQVAAVKIIEGAIADHVAAGDRAAMRGAGGFEQ